MKHIKLFEEISTPINPELLGVMNNPETLTRKAFSILADKYARNKDKESFNHLTHLAKKYHPEWLRDSDWVNKIAELFDRYNINNWADEDMPWMGTPEEREKMERESELAKTNLDRYESLENFKKEAGKAVDDLTFKYPFTDEEKKYMINKLLSAIRETSDLIKKNLEARM